MQRMQQGPIPAETGRRGTETVPASAGTSGRQRLPGGIAGPPRLAPARRCAPWGDSLQVLGDFRALITYHHQIGDLRA